MTNRRALLSVTDKTGVADFAAALSELGFGLLSTGGTHRVLREAGVAVDEVSDYTGFPEMMDGRLKTLHPRVHGGLLGRRGTDESVMGEHGIDPIDVLAVNLYRFRETAARPGVQPDEVIENIDIGGPAMLRSAAKNHRSVVVVVDPADYPRVIEEMRAGSGQVSDAFKREMAAKAFAHTAAYDTAIAQWFGEQAGGFSPSWGKSGSKLFDLRYGENPHQHAAFYRDDDDTGPSLAGARKLSGKELSYNNLLDLDAALALAGEFDDPACVIVKHGNPCGTALAGDARSAFLAALAADPLSAFGGIVAMNRALDTATAEAMVEKGTFVEAVIAPSVEDGAVEALGAARWGANVRVLSLGGGMPSRDPRRVPRAVSGGMLVMDADVPVAVPDLSTATRRTPDDAELRALRFAWKVCKHVKSNAIVLARADAGVCVTTGVGAGQMSRVDSVQIAVDKAGDLAAGSVLASDAFFPFADGLETAARAGVRAVIQPGGSKRDEEVVAAADAADVAMVFTGMRHFRH